MQENQILEQQNQSLKQELKRIKMQEYGVWRNFVEIIFAFKNERLEIKLIFFVNGEAKYILDGNWSKSKIVKLFHLSGNMQNKSKTLR